MIEYKTTIIKFKKKIKIKLKEKLKLKIINNSPQKLMKGGNPALINLAETQTIINREEVCFLNRVFRDEILL